jgi:hypothetical protein
MVKKLNSPSKNLTTTDKELLAKLIEMRDPDWITPELFETIVHKMQLGGFNSRDEFEKLLRTHLDVENIVWNDHHEYPEALVKASTLFHFYNDERLISSVFTGQDPKSYSQANYDVAGKHAGYHWGNQAGSAWHQAGAVNLIRVSFGIVNGKENFRYILDTVDIEHRLWGIIGFQMGLVPLRSSGEPLTFEHQNLQAPGNSIDVTGLTLPEIVIEANQNLKPGRPYFTRQDILDRFDRGRIKLKIFPMWTPEQCRRYYTTVNDHVEKTIAQLLHANSGCHNETIKFISSLKYHRSKTSDGRFHPFFTNCFSDATQTSLETFMVTHMITQFVLNGNNFVDSGDVALEKKYSDTNGYYRKFDRVTQDTLWEHLNLLENVLSITSKKDNPARQRIQQILALNSYLESNSFRIHDHERFGRKIHIFFQTQMWNPLVNGKKNGKTTFGMDMGSQTKSSYKKAFVFLCREFLKDCSDEKHLNTLGIVRIAEKPKRVFSKEQIQMSRFEVDDLDIDGTPFDSTTDVVGGHIISDYEIACSTPEQLNAAAVREGIDVDGVFIENNNCRAMSKYHNNRMGVLPLSEYMKILGESKVVVSKAREDYKKMLNDQRRTNDALGYTKYFIVNSDDSVNEPVLETTGV